MYRITVKSKTEYMLVTVSSKAGEGEELPFVTRCWAATNGQESIDASKTKLAIVAEVTQGNRPVLNAKVE